MKQSFASNRGAALLLTLWCIAVVSLLVILTARIVDADVDVESARARRFEAREFALSGIAYGRSPKLADETSLLHQKREDGARLDVRILSESGRVNINNVLASQDMKPLRRLFTLWGASEQDISVAVDSLQDWVDKDELHRNHGAERAQLEGQTKYSLPQNRPFRSVDEMARVQGMDAIARLKPDWPDAFSVYSGKQIDLQSASADLLRAFGGLSSAQAADLIKSRSGPDGLDGTGDDIKITSAADAAAALGLSDAETQVLSGAFGVGLEPTRIESTAQVGGATSRIVVVTNRGQADSDLAWEER